MGQVSVTVGRVSVHKDTRGYWIAGVRVTVNGTTQRIGRSAKSRAEAMSKVQDAVDRVRAGAPATDSRETLRTIATRWSEVTLATSSRAETTKDLYRDTVTKIIVPKLGDVAVGDLTASDVEALTVDLGRTVGPSTIRRAMTVLRLILDTAVRDRLVASNVAREVARPAEPQPVDKAYTAQQLVALLAAAKGKRVGPIVSFMAYTGMRIGEAIGIRWADVDLDKGHVVIEGTLVRVKGAGRTRSRGKGSKATTRRVVDLAPAAVAALEAARAQQEADRAHVGPDYWTDSGYVFTTPIGTPVDDSKVRSAYYVVAEAAGVGGSPHWLRHTFATLLAAEGEYIKTISELLGHSKVTMTMQRYGHVTPIMRRTAVDRFAGVLSNVTDITDDITEAV